MELNIKLTDYGFDDTIETIKHDLESALGNKVSKKRKDEMIYKSLGALDTIWNLLIIEDHKDEDDESGV